MSEYILEMKNISKSFYGVKVLDDVHLEVKPGEVHVLLGENGAGKSTLIKILSAAYRKDSGQIFVDGKEINEKGNFTELDAMKEGISVIYQELVLNPYVSIWENMFIGREKRKGIVLDKAAMIQESKQFLSVIGLDVDPRTIVGTLSVAQKQLVEIAKALSRDLKILVLDEPTAAITDRETERLFGIIRDLKKKEIGIIYISHRMQELFEIGDRCTVFRNGQFIKTVELGETNESELTYMMAGKEVVLDRHEHSFADENYIALRAENIRYRDIVKGISFELKKGEILGFSGLVGAGRTELAKSIIGAFKRDEGEVWVRNNEKKLSGKDVKEAIDNGVVYLSEDRKDEGVSIEHSIHENIILPNMEQLGQGIVHRRAADSLVKEYMDKLRVKAASPMETVKSLSGGNIQKVVMAKWLANHAEVYIFDEPTRGIDVGARQEIYLLMRGIIAEGGSIILISSDMVELLKMSDRIIVIHEGEIAKELINREDLTQEEVLSYALRGGN